MAMLSLQVLQEYFAAATLYSEDLQAGRDWAGLRVVNPFHSK